MKTERNRNGIDVKMNNFFKMGKIYVNRNKLIEKENTVPQERDGKIATQRS